MPRKIKQNYLDEVVSPLEITPLKFDLKRQKNGRLTAVLEKIPVVVTPGSVSDPDAESLDSERAGWGSKIQFLLSVVAYAVGLGNVWRFPYLCQQNGGGAFLIPYFIMLVIEGIPLCVLELGIGQKMRLGSIGVWSKIHPLLGGLGISCALVALLVGMYYNGVIAWCFFYLFSSLQAELPWAKCPLENATVSGAGAIVNRECAASSPTEYFWFRETLDVTASIDDFGGIQLKIAGCLAFSWILIFICMAKGIENSGKIMYFTAGFPYLVLVIFFGRAITLRGAFDGLRFLFTPDMQKLLDPIVWLDAATQIFYSLGLGFGSLIAFGSYNPTDNKFTRDAIFVSLTNAFTAIFASILIFAILGFKATMGYDDCLCREIKNISGLLELTAEELSAVTSAPKFCREYHNILSSNTSAYGLPSDIFTNSSCSFSRLMTESAEGTGLAFIVFTQAIVELPWAPFWSVLFFTMLLALGMGSMFGNFSGIQTSLFDLKLFPWMKKQVVSAIICFVSFIVGILFVTKAGMYWIGMFDNFVGTFSLMVIALLEMVGVCWIYKYDRFAADVREMTGQTLSRYWEITLKFLAPGVILFVLAASIAVRIMKGISYSAYDPETAMTHPVGYPVWAQIVAMILVMAGILPILIVAILRMCGVTKYEPDPSIINAGFNSSASTTMFANNPNASSGDIAGMTRLPESDDSHAHMRVYRPQFFSEDN